jgi:D-alanyl-D-alanine carboxypeptidase
MSDATLLPRDGNPELADPASHGYLNATCVREIEGDGGQAAEGTDTSAWNVSYGQAAGGMSSTVDDLGIWAASVSGNALLSDDLARRRLRTSDIGGVRYGLGVMEVGDWYGHEGEALGWEALVLHNPDTGVSLVMATNACAGAPLLFVAIADSLYPGTGLGELLG